MAGEREPVLPEAPREFRGHGGPRPSAVRIGEGGEPAGDPPQERRDLSHLSQVGHGAVEGGDAGRQEECARLRDFGEPLDLAEQAGEPAESIRRAADALAGLAQFLFVESRGFDGAPPAPGDRVEIGSESGV